MKSETSSYEMVIDEPLEYARLVLYDENAGIGEWY